MPLTILNKNGSVSVVSNPEIKSSVDNYVEITILNPDVCPNTVKKKVNLFAGTNCCIRFYDVDSQKLVTKNGKVTAISKEYLVMSTFNVETTSDPCSCIPNIQEGNFIYKTDIIIPYNNITDVIVNCIPYKPNEVVLRTMIIGITAEMIKAIVVRLGIMQDGCPEPKTTYVDMKVGNTYHITYSGLGKLDRNTIYELEGRLIRIEEVPNTNYNCPTNESLVKPAQCVSMNNNTYDSSSEKAFNRTQEEFQSDVIFTFDTSTTMDATFDHVHLVQIRDCKLVSENEQPVEPPPVVDPSTPSEYQCNCCTPQHITLPDGSGIVTYITNNGKVSDINVKTADGNDMTVQFEELIKFYLGIN